MKKIIIVSMLSFGLVLSAFGAHNAFANNHGDTNFFFSFGADKNVYTDSRPKYDNSSAYIKPTTVLGGSAISANVVLKNRTSIGPTKAAYVNQGTYLTNYAYETYGYRVQVRIKGSGAGAQAASGVWSPDSI